MKNFSYILILCIALSVLLATHAFAADGNRNSASFSEDQEEAGQANGLDKHSNIPPLNLREKKDGSHSGDFRPDFRDASESDERRASPSAIRHKFDMELSRIKDQKKQLILQKLADKMNQVKTNRVSHWKQVLARLQQILDKIKATDKHNAELDAAIASASAKISLAQAAVDAQAGKEYTINIASGSALKTSAGTAVSGEQHDLQTILKLINDARQSVYRALMILKRSFGGPLPKSATDSGHTASDSGSF